MSFYKDTTTTINSTSNLIHEIFSDLTNNFVYFHEKMKNKTLSIYENQPPLWDNYLHINQEKDNILENPSNFVGKQLTVRVPTSLIYTSDAEIAYIFSGSINPDAIGFDRLHLYGDIDKKGASWLKKQRGYSPVSETIHGTVRWIFDDNGNVIGFAISKDRGNARTHMAIASRGGQDGDILINLHFHEINPDLTLEDMKQVEGANFSEDGEDRRGLDPKTKFRSGYAAKLPKYVSAIGWLKSQDIDFADIVKADFQADGKQPPEFSLTSMSHLDFGVDGSQHGDFTKYHEININSAINVLKQIYTKNNISKVIQVSFVNVLSRAFYYLTSDCNVLGLNASDKAITTRPELTQFLVWYYTRMTENYDGTKVIDKNIQELKKKGEDKDLSWKAFETFLIPALEAFAKKKGRINFYRSGTPALNAFIESIDNSALRKEATRILDSAEGNKAAA